jgi:hypothetical protein
LPQSDRRRWLLVLAGTLAVGLLAACGGHPDPESLPGWGTQVPPVPDAPGKFSLPPPPWRDPDIFPCSQCHDDSLPPNPKRRKLEMAHDDIVLRHDEQHRWCLDCHDANNRDKLHLASGELVDFSESYRLCGQCHGDKYRDWREGIHGRRTGSWNGEKQYLLCVACHWAHDPHFKPLAPMPPPVRPGSLDK